MPVTGLRVRYFLTLTGVLFLVAVVSLLINAWVLKNERIAHLDQQIITISKTLIDSKIFTQETLNNESTEKMISALLGQSRIGKLITLRDQNGAMLFESAGSKLINSSLLPVSPEWTHTVIGNRYVRIYNLKTPEMPNKFLQLGFVAEEKIINARVFTRQSVAFLVLILFIGLTASYFSTSFLLKPISELENFITESGQLSKNQTQLPLLPPKLLGENTQNTSDEFTRLVFGLNRLIEKVNKNHQLSRLWAYQMAHELKTPLSILSLEVENIGKQKQTQKDTTVLSLKVEIEKISGIINSFLAWAELENSPQQQKIFVNDLYSLTKDVTGRIFKNSPRSIEINFDGQPSVVCNPQHLEQIITNLVSNADAYSEKKFPIYIAYKNETLVIKDMGKGLPDEVLKRLGEPFNRGHNTELKSGHGLGLAWIKSICKLYSWNIEFQKTPDGTEVHLKFNNEDIVQS